MMVIFGKNKCGMICAYRAAEMWEELQATVDKLLEARPQERNVLATRGRSHPQPSQGSWQQV